MENKEGQMLMNPKNIVLIRIGECNHCGLCCKPPIIIDGPTIDRGEDRCKFYIEETNNRLYGHCLIQTRGDISIKEINDRFGKKITTEQIRWFKENCLDYPRIEDIVAGNIPAGCSFGVEEQEVIK